ncbi:MAG: HAMP domain-containing sensor histidine kinase, partial [Sedimentisphaerales bacterium]|nr:HAMP domain-containing sensor histidine kinase [Sedimentisphaerales bacterium]
LCIFKNIISNALVGAMGEVSPKLKGNLTVADQEICRLGKIISDFVDIAEIDRGIITLRTKRFALQSAVANTIKSLTPLAAAKNIRLTVVAPDSELLLDADYNRLVQVLTNLLGNAIKFTPAGGQVVIRLKDIEDDIFVEVEDNGVGVAADDISKVFSRFVQIEKQVGAGEHGIGLGLSITKALIEMHGGHIWAESTPGQGSVFCFTLPKHAKTSAQSVEIPATEQNHIAS